MLQYNYRMLGKNLPFLRLPHRTRFLAFAFYIYRDNRNHKILRRLVFHKKRLNNYLYFLKHTADTIIWSINVVPYYIGMCQFRG